MAYGMTSASGYKGSTQATQREAEIDKAGAEAGNKGMASGAMQGAMTGATLGAGFGPLGMVGGAIIGATAGAFGGGAMASAEGREAKKQELDTKRRSDILARQTRTAMQQEARAASGPRASTAKAPTMGAVSGVDAAMQAMPATTGKGTAYDAWRSTVYGG